MFHHNHHPDLFLMPPDPLPIPKLGQTRCYWALLSAELDFLYIDPVFRSHLGPQAHPIIGKKLLEFVHPDEHNSAHQDLGKVLESRTLHGSVTRVRYSRLGRLRARLGYTGVHETFTDEDKVSFDENYMACDLVINWAAEGLVLCFIHAVVDMSPQDNDEHHRTHWTNWCGTPPMTDEGSELYNALFNLTPQAAQHPTSPTRVFQILHNSTDRPTLFSWPSNGYHPADYGRLANDVQIGGANGSDAKTSCTRRYKAQQILNSTDGSVRDVESIFIPHGHIIFACHKATPHRPRGHPNSYPLYPTPAQFSYEHPPSHQPPYYPPPVVPSQIDAYPPPPHNYHPYHGHHHHAPAPPPPPPPPLAGPSSPSTTRGSASPYPWSTTYPDPLDQVPPPRRRATPEREGGASGGGRTGGNPPAGVSRCAACKSTSSPEWRKGPSGRKDLCNACGLRFSRARAKKEGVVVQRRRKEGGAPAPARRRGSGSGGGANGAGYHGELSSAAAAGESTQTQAQTHTQTQAPTHTQTHASPSPSPPGDYPAASSHLSGMYHQYAPPQGNSTMYASSSYTSHSQNGYAMTSSSSAPPSAPAPASSYERAHVP